MPGENLTRIEARERAEIVAPSHYDVALDLTTSTQTFTSRSTVQFTATAGASTFIDLIAPRVHEVILNGSSLDVDAVFADSRIELADLAAQNELTVVADCAYMNTGEGLHRFVDPVDGEVYLYSQFEVADTRRMFAVFEQPDLKASFSFTVTAPQSWQVVSNSPTPTPAPAGDGVATWAFEPTPVLPCYVTALVAGPYHRVSGELTSRDGRTIPLGVFCRASLADYLDAENIMAVTRAGFAFYEQAFDMAYPFSKYDQLFVPEFNAGAMENAGCITIVEKYVFRSKAPQATVERRTVTILHELAHMWFGDLVTMRWWNDLWLNESFAEYASTLATSQATDWSGAWTTFASLEKGWAYRQDQLPSTHPIVAEIEDLEAVEVNFDGITYAKGASVLKQLVAWVGQEEFLAGVREYFRKHAWGNTELPDLLTELEATSGRDLSAWSRAWLQESGVNTIRPEVETDANGRITSLQILQNAPEDHPVLRPHRIAVGGYNIDAAGNLVRTHRSELDVAGAATAVPDFVGLDRPQLLLLNDDDLAYTKIRLDPDSLSTATAHLSDITESLPRSLVWTSAWDMTRDAEWPASRYLDLLLRHVGAETESTVVQVQLRQLATAVNAFTDPRLRDQVQERVAEELWELTRSAEPRSDSQFQFLRAYAAHARSAEHVQVLRSLLDGTLELPGLAMDADLRWDLLTALAALGQAAEEQIAAELERDGTSSGRNAAASARAAIPTTAAKEAAWQSVVVDHDLPNAVQTAVIAGFTRGDDATVLAGFVDRYFEVIEQVWATRTNEMAQNIVIGLYPARLADIDSSSGVDVLARTDRFIDQLGGRRPALRRLLVEARDGVRRSLTAQQRDRAGG